MHRQSLLILLRDYEPATPEEARVRDEITEFVREHHDCFLRELLVGHVTGSAWVVDKTLSRVLLTHHRKLNKWLQLGGHCDGEYDVLQVAIREAVEESGVFDIVPFSSDIFDIDIHAIPERANAAGAIEPAHFHYDVRFILVADDEAPLKVSAESHDLRWLSLDEISSLTQEESILRMVAKTRVLARRERVRK
jgi:8-oxo-dGTP pyrophosphatase MutT (NUDIX family)